MHELVSIWNDQNKALSELSLQSESQRRFLAQVNSPELWNGGSKAVFVKFVEVVTMHLSYMHAGVPYRYSQSFSQTFAEPVISVGLCFILCNLSIYL